MINPKKLPSGKWRARVLISTDLDGKRHYKSVTAETKRECIRQAEELQHDARKRVGGDITVREALDQYIDLMEKTKSASTIRTYRSIARSQFSMIEHVRINMLSDVLLQEWINGQIRAGKTPKTIRNQYFLLLPAIKLHVRSYEPQIRLPNRTKAELYTPTVEDVKTALGAALDDEMRLCILLGAFGPLRRGEICALEKSDYRDRCISVTKDIVLDQNGTWVTRPPKTLGSIRTVSLEGIPEAIRIIESMPEGRLINHNPDWVTDGFSRTLERANLPHFRFHDLRAFFVSYCHAKGISDRYIEARGGWIGDSCMRRVYMRTMADQAAEADKQINEMMSSLI